jgi:hypothetical protein
MTSAGLESAIPGSAGRRLIHWAVGPAARDRRFVVAFGRAARFVRGQAAPCLPQKFHAAGEPLRPREARGPSPAMWLRRGHGATVARLTPDQKVGSLNLSALIVDGSSPTPSSSDCQVCSRANRAPTFRHSSAGGASGCRFTRRSGGPWFDSKWPDLARRGDGQRFERGGPSKRTATRQPNSNLEPKRLWRLRCRARCPTIDKATRDSDIARRGRASRTAVRRGRRPQSGRAGGGYPARASTRPGGTLGKGPRCARISGRSGTPRHGLE